MNHLFQRNTKKSLEFFNNTLFLFKFWCYWGYFFIIAECFLTFLLDAVLTDHTTGGSITSTNGYAVREYISTGGIRKSTVTIDDNATLSGALGERQTVPEIIGDVTGNITANQSGQVS